MDGGLEDVDSGLLQFPVDLVRSAAWIDLRHFAESLPHRIPAMKPKLNHAQPLIPILNDLDPALKVLLSDQRLRPIACH